MYATPRGELAATAPATATGLDNVNGHAAGGGGDVEHDIVEGGTYTCDHGCGYLGAYDDVAEHEKVCTVGRHRRGNDNNDDNVVGVTHGAIPPSVAPPVQGQGDTKRETPAGSASVPSTQGAELGVGQGGDRGTTQRRDTISARKRPRSRFDNDGRHSAPELYPCEPRPRESQPRESQPREP